MCLGAAAQGSELLLQACSSCLREVASLRQELRQALQLPGHGAPGPEAGPPADALAEGAGGDALQGLLALCVVEDASLREHLVAALVAGEPVVELRDLALRIWGEAGGPPDDGSALAQALLAELEWGSARALVLRGGRPASGAEEVRAAVEGELRACAEGRFGREAGTFVAVLPRFERPSWHLVEALLLRCQKERLAPPMDLLHEAMSVFLYDGTSGSRFSQVDLLSLLSTRPTLQGVALSLTAEGRIAVARGPDGDAQDDGPRPFPLYHEADEARVRRDHAAGEATASALLGALEHAEPGLGTALWLGSGRAHAGGAAGEGAQSAIGVLLCLLGVLCTPAAAQALGLSEAAWCHTPAGALLWAIERTSRKAADEQQAKSDSQQSKSDKRQPKSEWQQLKSSRQPPKGQQPKPDGQQQPKLDGQQPEPEGQQPKLDGQQPQAEGQQQPTAERQRPELDRQQPESSAEQPEHHWQQPWRDWQQATIDKDQSASDQQPRSDGEQRPAPDEERRTETTAPCSEGEDSRPPEELAEKAPWRSQTQDDAWHAEWSSSKPDAGDEEKDEDSWSWADWSAWADWWTAVEITDQDRVPPKLPVLEPLRPEADPRMDAATLLRFEPAAPPPYASALLLLPGGNYDTSEVPLKPALALAEQGVLVFVLRYRLRSQGHFWPKQREDCELALRRIREQVVSFGVESGTVGVMGFSAGGHLASVAATTFPEGLKPDFQVLVSTTIDVETPYFCPWMAKHGFPGPDWNTAWSVDGSTPPVFAAVSTEDTWTSYADNVAPYVTACEYYGVPAEVVLAPMGEHDVHDGSYGMDEQWTLPFMAWMLKNGWMYGSWGDEGEGERE